MAAPPPTPPPAKASLPPVQHATPRYEERPAMPQKEAASRQVSGPSFLGLGQEPVEDKSFSYLFEDETPTHRGRNLVMILLLAAAAAAIWYWRQDLRAVADRLLNTLPAATKPAATDKTDSNSPAPATTDSTTGGTSPPTAPQPGGTAAQTPAAQNPAPPATGAGTAPPPEGSGKSDSTQGGAEAQAPSQSPAENASPKASPAHDESGETADSDEAPAAPPSTARKPVTKAARTTPVTSRADDLEAQGEKYLYGNGVPENCTRARTNLLAAAEHSNAQAQSVLGTMYATGHCATRDLPTAYRWFGRSLRQDPKNTRLEQDLKVLWNQMTPGERQSAMRSGR